MSEQIPKTFRDWREARRFRAWQLKQKGWKQADIAEALGVTPAAVSQWLKRGREGGITALRTRPGCGPKLKLTTAQLERLPELLRAGEDKAGIAPRLPAGSRCRPWSPGSVRRHRSRRRPHLAAVHAQLALYVDAGPDRFMHKLAEPGPLLRSSLALHPPSDERRQRDSRSGVRHRQRPSLSVLGGSVVQTTARNGKRS
jgi:transposase